MTTTPDLRRIAGTLHRLRFPTRFAVEVTAECNLACSMCHHPQMQRTKGVMPLALYRRCADQVAELSPRTEVWLSFCGEPLLEPELLLAMLAYGKSAGLRSQNVNTNGVHLTEDLDERLLDSGARRIVIGIDGFSRASYGKLRVLGDYELVRHNVERLLARRAERESGPEINVQFIECDENEGEREAFVAHWLARGATVKVRNKLSWGGRFDTPLSIAQDDRIPCPWAMTMMHVFWDGRVPRCPGDTEGDEEVGNAWDEPLETLWMRLGGYRDLHMAHRFAELPERCHSCKDWMVGVADRFRPSAKEGEAAE